MNIRTAIVLRINDKTKRKYMDKPKLLDVVNAVVTALEPFDSDERKRIIKAALTVLGEDTPAAAAPAVEKPASNEEPFSSGMENIHPAAQRWMKTYSITREELEQVFHIEAGGASVLNVQLPGTNKRTNSHYTYMLAAVAGLIGSGEAQVDDKSARALCGTLGCYDSPNHATTMEHIGNLMNGSKANGYKLTAPGQREAATLVKKIAAGGK
jgi:hypothetical protein